MSTQVWKTRDPSTAPRARRPRQPLIARDTADALLALLVFAVIFWLAFWVVPS